MYLLDILANIFNIRYKRKKRVRDDSRVRILGHWKDEVSLLQTGKTTKGQTYCSSSGVHFWNMLSYNTYEASK